MSRLGLGSALRRLADAGERCVLHCVDGTRRDGVLDARGRGLRRGPVGEGRALLLAARQRWRRCRAASAEPRLASLGRVGVVRRAARRRRAGATARRGGVRLVDRLVHRLVRCACARSCGGRGRAARGRRTPGRAPRAARRARALANPRTCRTNRPAWRAKSGSRSGPKTSTATNAITASSGSPTPNMAQNLAGRSEPELASCQTSAARVEALGHRGQHLRPAGRWGRSRRSACRRRRPRAATPRAGSARARARRTRSGSDSVAATRSPPPVPKISSRCSGPQCGQARKHMFSTTPTTRWCIIEAIVPARSATSAAASCGVVTTTTSAFGQVLAERDRDVAGARRQVEQEHVEVAPVDVGEHLHERPVEHRAAPGDDLVAARLEHADRDHRDAGRRRHRHDHVLDLGRPGVGDAEHRRDRVAVDVGVDDADLAALPWPSRARG